MINFDYSALLTPISGSASRARAPAKAAPTAPWDARAKPPPASERVKAALQGTAILDVAAFKRKFKGAANEDYAELFALYGALESLDALAKRMDVKEVNGFERSRIQRAFDRGLKSVDGFIETLDMDKLRLIRGEAASLLKSAGGVPRPTNDYKTRVVHHGSSTDAVPTLGGDVRFRLTVSAAPAVAGGAAPKVIDFDLAQVGADDERTLAATVAYLNKQLADAEVKTRFQSVKLPQEPRTLKVGDRTITLPAGPDRWSLRIAGTASETLNFSAPATADAVYLAQTVGKDGAQARELVKFQTDAPGGPPAVIRAPGEEFWTPGRAFARGLDADVAAVRASATAADGSVYLLAEVAGAVDGQALKTSRDVALLKYDSAGELVFSRTLGAAGEVEASAVAVGADGRVAIGGSVTGDLANGDISRDATTKDSFVTLFNADGEELWTRRKGAVGDDAVKSLAFGADGAVYAAGSTKGPMPAAAGFGGEDGWLQGYAADGRLAFTQQFGTSGADAATSVAVEGDQVVTAGVENGRAVLRRFALDAQGAAVAGVVRDLGDLGGGNVVGVAFHAGKVLVAGATTRDLGLGVTQRAHAGGRDAFVASLDADLGGITTGSYWGGGGTETVAAAAFRDGQVFITGATGGAVPDLPKVGQDATAQDGFVARIDAATGVVGWTRRFTARDGQAAPTAISVGGGGASALDRLGLPSGVIDFTDSPLITAATSARGGDRFYLRAGDSGAFKAVTLEPSDTIKTLADKIKRVAGFAALVTVIRDFGTDADGLSRERLHISARNSRTTIETRPGEAGRDLLTALGLAEGVASRPELNRATDAEPAGGKTYGLTLDRTLRLDDKAQIKRTVMELATAMSTVRTAYNDLASALRPPQPKAATGAAPAYMRAQLANYQAGLSRLVG